MIMKVQEGENTPPMCYHSPDDTPFEMNHPLHGWIRVIPADGRLPYCFNAAYVIAMIPDTEARNLEIVKR